MTLARDRIRRGLGPGTRSTSPGEEMLGKTRANTTKPEQPRPQGMENEAPRDPEDRADIARQRGDLNAMRGTYDVDRGWVDMTIGTATGQRRAAAGRGERKHDRDGDDDGWRGRGNRGERGDAWRELHKDQAELRKP